MVSKYFENNFSKTYYLFIWILKHHCTNNLIETPVVGLYVKAVIFLDIKKYIGGKRDLVIVLVLKIYAIITLSWSN